MKLKGFASVLFCTVTAILLSLSSVAVNIPEPSPSFYVYDSADVISSSTEKMIISQNEKLAYATGAEIVIATVNTTEGESVRTFSNEMFAKWSIGDAEKKNGVLVLLVIDDDNYWVTQGNGIDDSLTSAEIKALIDTYLEPSFAAKDYDTGVNALFSKLLEAVADLYSVDLEDVTVPTDSAHAEKDSGGPHPVAVIGIILGIALVLTAIALAVRYFLLPGQYRFNRRPKIAIAPGTGYGNGAPTGARPNAPAGARPNAPTGARPNAPAGARPNAPVGARPNAPAGARPNVPAGARPNAPAGARPNTPAGARPNVPAGARPNVPAGARPNTPAGARPNAPGGTYPASNAPRSVAPTGRSNQTKR